MKHSTKTSLQGHMTMYKTPNNIITIWMSSLIIKMEIMQIRAVVLIITTDAIKNHQEKETTALAQEVIDDQIIVLKKMSDA
jgi:hypothetical protein